MRNFRLDVERHPATPVAFVPESGPSAFVSDVRTVWDAVLARRLVIAASVGASLFLAIAYIWSTPPIYSSTAEVLIDPRQQEVFEQEIVPGGMGSSSLGADTFLLDSQVEVILSQSILRRVIEEQGLLDDPDFAGNGGSGGIVGALKGLARLVLRGPQASRLTPATDYDRALKTLEESLDVWRKGNTYVLAVTMESENPVKSADIANAITETYMAEVNSYTRSRISDVEDLLGGRLEELRAAALESQRRVEAYRAEHGLLSAEKLPVIEQQLRDLNQQLGLIATTTIAARARWDEIAKLQGQPVERQLASGSLDSPLLNALREQYSSLAAREASLSATLMPRHPSLQALRDAKASLQADIGREVDRLVSRYRVEYDVALANEESIRSQLARLESATAASNQATVTLRDLERQAQANADIYQQFLDRSKDAREQVNLPSAAARVISRAFPASSPTWPLVPIVLAAALVVGLVFGLCLALLLHLLGATPRPMPVRSLLDGARA